MNDFLQGLRSRPLEKQRPPMTRKNYDMAFNNSNPRYPSEMRSWNSGISHISPASQTSYRHDRTQCEKASSSILQNAIEGLNTHAESFAGNQKILINAHEKTATMLERQVIAIERILNHLNISSK